MQHKMKLTAFCMIIGWMGWACENTSKKTLDDLEISADSGERSDGSRDSISDTGGFSAAVNSSRRTTVTNGSGVEECGPKVSQLFRYALCSCGDSNVVGHLQTDAFDSDEGPFTGAILTGAAIGTNGTLFYSGNADFGGSLIVAGLQGLTMPGHAHVRGDLRVQGPFSYAGKIEVANNCWLASESQGAGNLRIAGNLIMPATASAESLGFSMKVDGKTLHQSVTVQPPCACDDKELVNVAQTVTNGRTHNDNAITGFNPTSLSNVYGTQRVEVPARAFATSINVFGDLTLVIHQKTSLFVGGDMTSTGTFTLEMDPQSDFDLFIGGNLFLTGHQIMGNLNSPAKVRIYVAGDQEIAITGHTAFAGNLYAPRATVSITGHEEFYGAIFAGNIKATGHLHFHYDSAILREGDNCDTTDQCDDCTDCEVTSGCVDGKCSDCRVDKDCCEPLVCVNGQCGSILL